MRASVAIVALLVAACQTRAAARTGLAIGGATMLGGALLITSIDESDTTDNPGPPAKGLIGVGALVIGGVIVLASVLSLSALDRKSGASGPVVSPPPPSN